MAKKKAAGKKKAATAVTRRQSSAVSTDVQDYGADAGSGFEHMKREDFAIPFFGILQKLSPQCDEDEAAYVEGAEPGMLFNSVTKELTDGDEGARFIPCHAQRSFVEWIPRAAGGGFVMQHEVDSPVVASARDFNAKERAKKPTEERTAKIKMANGHELVETSYIFGLLLPEGDNSAGAAQQVILALSSSQLKKYREWMTKARNIKLQVGDRVINPPLWAHIYRLTSIQESNDKGKWYGWKIAFDGESAEDARLFVEDELYQMARSFRDMATSGRARAAVETIQQEPDATPEEDDL